LHANLSSAKLDPLTILCAYRTNPHRDHAKTGRAAGALLLEHIAGRIEPTHAWRSLPMVIGGGWTLDFLPPTRGLFKRMRWWEKQPGVLRCSIFMSHLWLDQAEIGWSTYVLTDGDQQLAETIAEDLADRCWALRRSMPPEVPGVPAVFARIRSLWLRRRLGVIALCDASDVVGAGAPGDSTHLLNAALEQGKGLLWYFSIRDPVVTQELAHVSPGSPVELEVGGRLDPDRSQPIAVAGTLLRWEDTESFGQVATLDLGHIKLVVTEGANLAMKPSFYRDRQLPMYKADVCVVKSFFPFRLYFLPYARKCLYVRTSGTTDLDVWRQHQYARPTWPQQDPPGWRASDRIRRGLA
ncbi:MAG TPA: hypothetical protein DCQ06_05010, partial [Myxococcales bacterium]|nr:hypothetical protein [Myxococcales bacterium]